MARLVRVVGVQLCIPGDEDLIQLVDELGKGNVGKWVRAAMREAAARLSPEDDRTKK